MAQTAVRSRQHLIDRQSCGWLLASIDPSRRTNWKITQKLVANMLGVHRSGVSEPALKIVVHPVDQGKTYQVGMQIWRAWGKPRLLVHSFSRVTLVPASEASTIRPILVSDGIDWHGGCRSVDLAIRAHLQERDRHIAANGPAG
jgi:hypothetical protein